ncbi:MAG: DUF1761 domain-containing protein [Balneolaceae bacterium]|nr:DUF1761 domain-containing protein [Balneolaceae bacterium]MBO6546380.1 DUF1761 domain-containing protein [Balneolaceae bacterium]MBO6648739.1 DUF1761 domain-containing protein [Balneolaceae bacterium]
MEAEINYLAVLVASLIGFVVGFLWYGPLFGKAWMAEVGMTEEKQQSGNMAKIFGTTFVLQVIMTYCLAMFLADDSIDLAMGAFYGFLTGAGWILPTMIINNLYEQRSFKLSFIQGGYWVVVFTLMGLVLGAWR